MDRALDLARAGDEQGFSELWRTLHPPLLRYLAVRGNESPEDIAAETWLQVIRDLPAFVGGAPEFRAWLFTVGRNRAIDHGRARAARPAVPVAEVVGNGQVPSAELEALDRASTEVGPAAGGLVAAAAGRDGDVARGRRPGRPGRGTHRR